MGSTAMIVSTAGHPLAPHGVSPLAVEQRSGGLCFCLGVVKGPKRLLGGGGWLRRWSFTSADHGAGVVIARHVMGADRKGTEQETTTEQQGQR